MSASASQRAAVQAGALVDRLSASFARELDQVLVLLTAKIKRLAKQFDTAGARIASTRLNLTLALQLRQDLLTTLEQAGYHDLVVAALDAPLDRLTAQMVEANPVTVNVGAFDVDALVAMRQLRLAELLQVGEDIGIQMWRVVVDGVLGARPVLDLVDDVSDLLDISARHARTVYDTAISTYGRKVAQLGSTGKPDEAWFYVGPVDSKIRPFCLQHVGKVYSRTSIDDMDNGQLPDVFTTGGGYNCRHIWQRVSPLDAELLALKDTDQRSDAVQIRVDDSHLEEVAA